MALPKISVITVAYNSAATIEGTIRSVASQDYPSVEHIVIDGASSDETMEIVRQFVRTENRVVSETDSGIYDAMNKGLRLATGDVVGFLNSDDVFARDDSLSLLASAFNDDLLDAAYGDLELVKAADLSKIVRYWRPGVHKVGSCAAGWIPPHPTFYARRALLEAVGGFNEDYRLQADFDLMLRLFEHHDLKAVYIPKTLVKMREGGATTGSLRNIIRGNLEAAAACRASGFRGGWFMIARKLAKRVPQFFSRPS